MRYKIKMAVMIVDATTHFTSRASATIPAASGAEAEVPVCLMVQVFLRSVVACETYRNSHNDGFWAVGNWGVYIATRRFKRTEALMRKAPVMGRL
jgi:hypothetical protein